MKEHYLEPEIRVVYPGFEMSFLISYVSITGAGGEDFDDPDDPFDPWS